jgi:hypothetical protein
MQRTGGPLVTILIGHSATGPGTAAGRHTASSSAT